MKSPHTLIALHERAIRMQEMIARCEYTAESHSNSVERYEKDNKCIWSEAIKHHSNQYGRYLRISNYLQTRYVNLLNQLK